ncbi:hypothetical protein Tco_0215728 [Tanacetum coccineum]
MVEFRSWEEAKAKTQDRMGPLDDRNDLENGRHYLPCTFLPSHQHTTTRSTKTVPDSPFEGTRCDVSICDVEILDELTTSRGKRKIQNLCFKEDICAQEIIPQMFLRGRQIESFNWCGESCTYFNNHLKANNILLNENGMAKPFSSTTSTPWD